MTAPEDWTFTHERQLGLGYLYLHQGTIARTIAVADGINVDVAEDGTIIGVEMLNLWRAGDTENSIRRGHTFAISVPAASIKGDLA